MKIDNTTHENDTLVIEHRLATKCVRKSKVFKHGDAFHVRIELHRVEVSKRDVRYIVLRRTMEDDHALVIGSTDPFMSKHEAQGQFEWFVSLARKAVAA